MWISLPFFFFFMKRSSQQSNRPSPQSPVSAGGQLLPQDVWLKTQERKMKGKSSGFWLVVRRGAWRWHFRGLENRPPWASLKWLTLERTRFGSTPSVNRNFTVTCRPIYSSEVHFQCWVAVPINTQTKEPQSAVYCPSLNLGRQRPHAPTKH